MQRLILALLLLGASPGRRRDLALKRVMLSSAGVGYFEYEAEADGRFRSGWTCRSIRWTTC